MFNPVLEALFLRARDQYAATGRFVFFAVVGLALFHAAILTPWVEHQRQRSIADAEEQRFRDLDAEVADLAAELEAAAGAWQGVMTPALEGLADDLERDLTRLEATRQELAAAVDADGAPEESPPQRNADRGPQPLEIRNPDWIAAITEADNRYGLLAAFDPVVEQLIVRPRFAELNRTWREIARPAAEARLDGAAAGIGAVRGRFREAASEVAALEAGLTNLRRVLRDLDLRPPDQPYWWASPETSPSLELRLPPEVVERLRKPPALDEVVAGGELVAARQAVLAGRLERERRRSLAAGAGREQRLAGLGATLAGLGIDLHAVATLFPLLLGLLLAALMIRRNQRLRELGLATRLMAEDPASGTLRRWCLSQLTGGAIGGTDPRHDAEAAWRGGWLRALGALVLALAWIVLAAVQVRGLPDLDAERWLAVSVLGAVAVVIATLHRLVVARRLVLLASEVAPATGPVEEPPDFVEVEEPPDAEEEPPDADGGTARCRRGTARCRRGTAGLRSRRGRGGRRGRADRRASPEALTP